MKTHITKSRAGHYTVTLRNEHGYVIFHQNYIDNLHMARAVAAHAKENLGSKA